MQMPRFLFSLKQHRKLRSGFIGRIPGVDLCLDKQEMLSRLQPAHEHEVCNLGSQL